MKEGLRILKGIKEELNLPIITDVHETIQCEKAAQVADILQIPSFLCRQTDLVIAAAETGKVVNIKKGQFLGPQMMQNLAAKAASTGNDNIMFTERGTTFGFGGLVVDITGFPIMGHAGYPLIIDATHAVQQPGSAGATTGGNRDHVEVLARAALSTGIMAGVFLETHDDPDNAPSDGPNSIRLEDMKSLLEKLKLIDSVAKNIPVKF